jgi:hypothetical protein
MLAAFEELDSAFVLLRLRARPERSQIPAFAGAGILLSRVKPVLS